jgi:signal transduction histidine kinase
VLDVKMPGMNGIQVLVEIKKRYPRTEVILLTGQASTQDGVDGIKAGAFDYLTKPIELEHLVTKVTQAHERILSLEEKKREAERKALLEQQMITTERLASLGTLAAGVAHEINNPLAIINESAGWMKLLLKKQDMAGSPLKEKFQIALDKIENSLTRAKLITHQLLGFVKKPEAAVSEVDLPELVNDTLQLLKREAANKDTNIVQNIDSGVKTIWSNAYQLRQVLINLFTNAIHAIDKGGTMTICLEWHSDDVILYVSDTGGGIPKEHLAKIFEPFFTTKSPGEGTGLGLFVTRGIVEKLGGCIAVDTEIGKGTTFAITLPHSFRAQEGLKDCPQTDILKTLRGEQ